MAARVVALLRGVNVGGKRLLPMAALAKLLEQLGCTQVRTYIQSGNAVFTRPPASPLPAPELAAALEQRFGFAVPVVLRTAQEWERIVSRSPFSSLISSPDPKHLHAVFLADPLTAAQQALLESQATGQEQLIAEDTVIYLYLPEGVGRSRLALSCVGPKMPPTNTIRNWTTVLKLRELLSADT